MNFAYFARGREQTQFTQGRWTTLDNPHSIFQWRERSRENWLGWHRAFKGSARPSTIDGATIGATYEANWTDTPTCLMTTARNPHGLRGTPLTRPRAFSRTSLKDTVASSLTKSHQVSSSLTVCAVRVQQLLPRPFTCSTLFHNRFLSEIQNLSTESLRFGNRLCAKPFWSTYPLSTLAKPGLHLRKGGRGSVQWDQIEYILLCKIPSHIQSTQSMRKRNVVGWYNSEHWQWYGYGSIPIHTIFRGWTSIYQLILMFTRGIGFWPIPIFWSESDKVRKMAVTCPAAKLWSSQIDSPNQRSPRANHPRQAPACG